MPLYLILCDWNPNICKSEVASMPYNIKPFEVLYTSSESKAQFYMHVDTSKTDIIYRVYYLGKELTKEGLNGRA